MIQWSRTDRWWDREGESWEKKKKSDGTCSFIRPFTPVATATCLEGTQERRHHWQKQQRSREWVRANESKLDRQCVWMRAERGESRQQIYNWLHFSSLKEVWVWPSRTWLRSVMNIHSSLEVVQINVWIRSVQVSPTASTTTFMGVNITDIPCKKDTIMRYEIGRVNQTEANA